MTSFKNQTVAAIAAIFISAISLQAIVTVPPVQAQTADAQMVELA